MSESAPLWIAWGGSCLVAFIIGGAVGALNQKWSSDGELRTLRGQAHQAAADGKVCCDAAYVAIKYRPDCAGVKP